MYHTSTAAIVRAKYMWFSFMVVIITLKSPRPRAVKNTATQMNMNREATEGQNSAQNGPAYGAPASTDVTAVPERWAKRADFAQHIQMQRSRRALMQASSSSAPSCRVRVTPPDAYQHR